MPYITVESGVLTDEQKELLIQQLTEVSSEIMNVPKEFFTTTIKELPDKNFGIGGKTIDKVKAEYMEAYKQIPKVIPFYGALDWRRIIPNSTEKGMTDRKSELRKENTTMNHKIIWLIDKSEIKEQSA